MPVALGQQHRLWQSGCSVLPKTSIMEDWIDDSKRKAGVAISAMWHRDCQLVLLVILLGTEYHLTVDQLIGSQTSALVEPLVEGQAKERAESVHCQPLASRPPEPLSGWR